MIAASNLARAQQLVADLEATRAMLARLSSGEPLRVTLGTGSTVSEIVLSQSYLRGVRGDIASGLELRAGELAASLMALGVEP